MKLVVDISDILYMGIKEDKYHIYKGNIYEMIKNGTPLPKNHGRIGDLDKLSKMISKAYNDSDLDGYEPSALLTFAEMVDDLIDNAPTIIEADKGEE